MERIWIYQSNQELSQAQEQRILEDMGAFLEQWKAHGKPLSAGVEVRFRRFVVIRLDERAAKATGCSIDRCVRELKSLQEALGIDLFDRMQVAYRDKDTLKVVSRAAFKDLIQQGIVHADTIVFNNMVDNTEDYAQRWELPLKDSWHARVFKL